MKKVLDKNHVQNKRSYKLDTWFYIVKYMQNSVENSENFTRSTQRDHKKSVVPSVFARL